MKVTADNPLTSALGRSPTVTDVATHLHIAGEEVLEGREGARAYRTTTLSAPVGGDSGRDLADSRLLQRALDKLRIQLADDAPAAASTVRAAALADGDR